MPCHYSVEGQFVTVVLEGETPLEELRELGARALAEPVLCYHGLLMVDAREAAAAPTARDVAERAGWVRSLAPDRKLCCAVVVSGALRYGVAHMFHAYADGAQLAVNIFEEIAPAKRWLLGQGARVDCGGGRSVAGSQESTG